MPNSAASNLCFPHCVSYSNHSLLNWFTPNSVVLTALQDGAWKIWVNHLLNHILSFLLVLPQDSVFSGDKIGPDHLSDVSSLGAAVGQVWTGSCCIYCVPAWGTNLGCCGLLLVGHLVTTHLVLQGSGGSGIGQSHLPSCPFAVGPACAPRCLNSG